MLSLDGTFIFVFLSFIAFMLLMKNLFFSPVAAIKDERDALVLSGRQALEQTKIQQDALDRDIAEKLGAARRQAQGVIAEKRAEAQKQAVVQTSAAQAAARETVSAAAQAIAGERETVRAQLSGERDALARTIVDKLSTRSVAAV